MTIREEEVEAAATEMSKQLGAYYPDDMQRSFVRFDHMRAALLAAAKVRGARERDAVREECAEIADANAHAECEVAEQIAKHIRALKETGHG